MRGGKKKWIVRIGLVALLLLLLGGGLVTWEIEKWHREGAAYVEKEMGRRSKNERDPAATLVYLRDLKQFTEFCERVRAKNAAMGERNQGLVHVEVRSETEFDLDGKQVATSSKRDRVWFEDGAERRELLDRQNSGWMVPAGRPKHVYPLSRFAKPGDYICTYDGPDQQGERLAVRIRFHPGAEPDDKLSGWLWVDAETAEPIRFEGIAAKPPAGARTLHMWVDYRAAENQENQLARLVTEVDIPILRRTRKVVVEFSDYQPASAKRSADRADASATSKNVRR